jgi:hypothetical protein
MLLGAKTYDQLTLKGITITAYHLGAYANHSQGFFPPSGPLYSVQNPELHPTILHGSGCGKFFTTKLAVIAVYQKTN